MSDSTILALISMVISALSIAVSVIVLMANR
jgi:hypothetical protein